jgi:uncharacterized LabA/DUF88 family protein
MKAIYIDVQNIHRKTLDHGRMIDRQRLYRYLYEKYSPDRIYYVVWYIAKYHSTYQNLENIGYTMIFKETLVLPNGEVKGNVDIDIAIKVIEDARENGLTGVYLITNDGDYNSLVAWCLQRHMFSW